MGGKLFAVWLCAVKGARRASSVERHGLLEERGSEGVVRSGKAMEGSGRAACKGPRGRRMLECL